MEDNLEPLETNDSDRIIPVNIEEQMKTAYIDYSMSVIVGRALPDVRDGLKPVHRRVLFAMNELGLHFNKPYKKSARIVGEVLGKYHPHGDTSVYEAVLIQVRDESMEYCHCHFVPNRFGLAKLATKDVNEPTQGRGEGRARVSIPVNLRQGAPI